MEIPRTIKNKEEACCENCIYFLRAEGEEYGVCKQGSRWQPKADYMLWPTTQAAAFCGLGMWFVACDQKSKLKAYENAIEYFKWKEEMDATGFGRKEHEGGIE